MEGRRGPRPEESFHDATAGPTADGADASAAARRRWCRKAGRRSRRERGRRQDGGWGKRWAEATS